jgi:hypothetical protein
MVQLPNTTLLLGLLVLTSCSGSKKAEGIPIEPIPMVSFEEVFDGNNQTDQSIIQTFKTIYTLMQDTLTDDEEGQIIELVKVSKDDSTLHYLLEKMTKTGVLRNLIIRWDEVKVGNDNMLSEIFVEVMSYNQLSEEVGRSFLILFDECRFSKYSHNYSYSENYPSAGLQSLTLTLLHYSPPDKLPRSTKELLVDVLSAYRGTTSHQITLRPFRESLERSLEQNP